MDTKNKYEIVSSNMLTNIQNVINEYLESNEFEIFFVGGVTFQDGVFCQAILKIPNKNLPPMPETVEPEVVKYETNEDNNSDTVK